MRRSFLCLILTLLLWAWGESAPAAQEPGPQGSPTAEMEEPTFDLGEMVVTGSWRHLRLGDSPANVTVVPAWRVRQIKALDMGEYLGGVSGVLVRRSGSLGSLATVSVRGSFATETQVLLDGRPLNPPGVGTADLSLIPAEMVDRVEVVRGPYSALYGPYAMSGTVQIFTRRARPGQGRLTLQAGGLGTRLVTGEAGLGLGESWTATLVPTSRHSEGSRPNSASRLNGFFLRFDSPLGAEQGLTLSGGLQSSQVGAPGPQPPADPALRSISQLTLGDDQVSSTRDFQRNRNGFANFQWEARDLSVRAYYSTWRTEFHSEFLSFGNLTLSDSLTRESQGGLEARYRIRHLENSALTLGGLYEFSTLGFETVDLDTVLGTSTSTRFDAHRLNRALYLEESLVFPRVAVSLGVRLDSPSDFQDVVSPRVNFMWKPTDWLSLRAGWGRGYRPPTLFELDFPATPFAAGNPALRPQTSTSAEAGLEALMGRVALARFTVFRESVRDRITFAPLGAPGPFGPRFIPVNLNQFRKVGWEAELAVEPFRGFTLSGSHTRLDAVQLNQELVDALANRLEPVERPAAFTPRSLSSVTLSYRQEEGLSVWLQGQFVGPMVNYYANFDNFPQVTMDTKTLDAFNVWDMAVSHPVRLGDFEADLFLKVSNLFDQPYSVQFGNTVDDRNFPMPGRTVYFGIEPRF